MIYDQMLRDHDRIFGMDTANAIERYLPGSNFYGDS